MRVLSFTSLYPHPAQPTHGIFVENRLRQLVQSGKVDLRVIAPIPGNPLQWFAEGKPGRVLHECRHGIDVWHPTAPLPPFGGMYLAPLALACAGRRVMRRMIEEGFDFELIDAHYVYPDGAAALKLAREFGKPFVITARGTDVSLLPNYRVPRRRILETLEAANHIIAVSETLRARMTALGVPASKITVLRNGVDIEFFRPQERREARTKWDVEGLVILVVGNLIPLKGHDLIIKAVSEIPQATLLLAGDGSHRRALEILARSLGIADRVRFLGRISQLELRSVYSAADVMVLASEREGWPNVVLESLACGTPVIASDIDEVREVLGGSKAAQLVPRAAAGFRDALMVFEASPAGRQAARNFAEGYDWSPVTSGQLRIFEKVLAGERRR